MFHALFRHQVAALERQVEADKRRDPDGYARKNAAKRLAAVVELAFSTIPMDPASPVYRQGGTLGSGNRHWFRAKFYQQYRLFFRFDQKARIIVYAWVNDDDTKRAYGSRSDAYLTFGRMLATGNPPNDWSELLEACRSTEDG